MGSELACTLRLNGKSFSGKALLESSEILFSGGTRLKISFRSVTAVEAKDGQLHVHTGEGLAVFDLGSKAEKWREKIAHPKSVIEKLGVKAGQPVSVFGTFPPEFLASLEKYGAAVIKNKPNKNASCSFLACNEKKDLLRAARISKSLVGATALWIVYPKGQKSITEADVRRAGLKSGLVDVKVVSFNPTHTALKFVLPVSRR